MNVDIDECLDDIDTIKNVIVFECKQTKMNTNRVNTGELNRLTASPGILRKEDGVYCNFCNFKTEVGGNILNILTAHVNTKKHQANLILNVAIDEDKFEDEKDFYKKLTRIIIQSGIAIHIIDEQPFKGFLEAIMKKKMPTSKLLIKKYVNDVYLDILDRIRNEIRGKKIYIIIDECSNKRCGIFFKEGGVLEE